ncbi:hypothetical protein BWR60_16795 [Inquilinus limosus]|uniref:Uncharacterized protein n=1 Tax=Inquilinus limosus TaxID=171674 RepID=A0A211ZKS1_9PROT|nr:hypothetical protein BWR60_16795 [Inquilinus limosus]
MSVGKRSYYDLFSAPLAKRYLERLDRVQDRWEVHFLRRGYDFLLRDVPEGAISALNYLDLPHDRRAAVFAGEMPAMPLTSHEARSIRQGLQHLLAEAEQEAASGLAAEFG